MRCNCCGSQDQRPLFSDNGFDLVQCEHCSLLYLGNMPSTELRMTEMEAGHFAGGQRVIDAARQEASEQALDQRFRSYLKLASRHVTGGRWLDIGCGSGTLLALARSNGFEAEGIELTSERYEAAAANGLTVHNVPVEIIEFPASTFDVISLINVFSHLTNPIGTLAELHRILRPGGVLIVVTGEVSLGVKRSHVPRWNLGDHLYFLGEGTMQRLCEQVGLQIADVNRVWLPEELYSRENMSTKGLSSKRNVVKAIINKTPGIFPLFRTIMMRRNADNKIHSTTFELVKS